MSYHLRIITPKGKFGELSKVYEELDELAESLEQNNRILALCELADLYGAIEGFAKNLGVSMEEISKMSLATKRAFESGSRK
jgi:predicted house-cleaning noncanonical NTP pyrophosphatase (MazG superfamily)